MIDNKSLIVTVILTKNLSQHSGSFSKSKVTKYVENLNNSPMFCDTRVTPKNTEIVLLTDVKNLNNKSFQNVNIVNVRGKNYTLDALSKRFLLIEDYIRTRDDWTHAYMIDASDVVIFKRPPNSVNQLAVGVDTAKKWIRDVISHKKYRQSDELKDMLHSYSKIMYNAGIVGGSRANILHFLSDFRNRSLEHADLVGAMDMVYLNEYLVHTDKNLTLGYPHGPVHLPFWAVVRGCANQTCRHNFIRKTMGYYWFGHKIPSTWTGILKNEYFCANIGTLQKSYGEKKNDFFVHSALLNK